MPYISCQVGLGRIQVMIDLDLYLLRDPRVNTCGRQFQAILKHQYSTSSTSDTLKWKTQQAPEICWTKFSSVDWSPEQLVFRGGHSQFVLPISLRINSSHLCTNSKQDSTTPARFTQATQYGWAGRCHWILQAAYYIKPLFKTEEMQPLYLILRNRHRKTVKWGDKETCPK